MKMMKIISLLILASTLLSCNCAFSNVVENRTISGDIGTKRIPSGTIMKLKLLNSLNSDTLELGDQFDFTTIEDIKADNAIVIPAGSMVRGSIQKVARSRMLSKGAVVYLDFDHIVSPTGRQVPIKVGICSHPKMTVDGGLGSKTNYGTATVQNAKTTANIVKTATRWGWETGDEVLAGYPKYALAPLSAVVSAPAAGLYFLGDSVVNVFKKGDDLQLGQGENLNVMLLKPLDMPAY